MAGGVIELNFNPDTRTLRQFGFIALGGFGMLAAAAWFEVALFHFGLGAARVPVAAALSSLGVFAALCSLVAPRVNRVLWIGLSCVSFPIGWVVSNVVLVLLFFGVFLPVGLLMRALGHDPLARVTEAKRETYWSDAAPARTSEGYFKQF